MKRYLLAAIFLFPVVLLLSWVIFGAKMRVSTTLPMATNVTYVTNGNITTTNAATNVPAPAKP